MDKTKIAESLKKKRPKLSDSSLKTYVSLLSNLCSKLNIDIEDIKDKSKEVLEYVEKLGSVQSKKTILSACYILSDQEHYKTNMLKYCNETNSKYKEQKLSKAREDLQITFEDVNNVYKQLQANLKKSPTVDNYVDFLIGSLMSGVIEGIAPRRLEYADVKIKDYNVDEDNYLDVKKSVIVLNKYKTVKQYGQVLIPLPKSLLSVIKRFLKVNTSNYLLVHGLNKNFNASELSKRVQAIYGDGVGVDMLRSIYLSNFYKDMPMIEKMDDLAKQMGHSIHSALNYYVKK